MVSPVEVGVRERLEDVENELQGIMRITGRLWWFPSEAPL